MNQQNTSYCLIYNFAQHYRASVFKKMDNEMGFDFYFGDHLYWAPDIKEMNVSELKGFKKKIKNIKLLGGKFTWQKGAIGLVFKNYKHFILYGDTSYISNWIIVLLCKILRKKTYLWTHGYKRPLSWKEKLMTYPFFGMATKVLLYGNFSRDFMIKDGRDGEKMVCIYNSLDYENQLVIRKQVKSSNIYSDFFKNSLPVLIYIGRIQKSKKIDLVIEAMALLKEEGVYCNFVIVGEDKEQVNLNNLVSEKHLEKNVWFYGPSYDEAEIAELLYNADVCVSPGNVGLTAVHSFAYGTPVITHSNFHNQMPEFEVIKSNVNGGFFKEGDVTDLCKKIKDWISLDLPKREKVRQSAYAIIDEKYNPNYQVEVLRKVLS
ncbi:glycosyltransferase [Mucilaginibacter corticis]|uniref:Glycosyltransferase n=1 Tax=Mucilaginibacter corticis TaxID=2597670 RepID=A0A556MT70_9SPHI|nr:glycosyltransferase [Mucilaginibacter corticis]TSJ43075.1 glycosyltransferase [Mucilaginibacter corticis]